MAVGQNFTTPRYGPQDKSSFPFIRATDFGVAPFFHSSHIAPEALRPGDRPGKFPRQFLAVGPKSHSQLWDPRLEREELRESGSERSRRLVSLVGPIFLPPFSWGRPFFFGFLLDAQKGILHTYVDILGELGFI